MIIVSNHKISCNIVWIQKKNIAEGCLWSVQTPDLCCTKQYPCQAPRADRELQLGPGEIAFLISCLYTTLIEAGGLTGKITVYKAGSKFIHLLGSHEDYEYSVLACQIPFSATALRTSFTFLCLRSLIHASNIFKHTTFQIIRYQKSTSTWRKRLRCESLSLNNNLPAGTSVTSLPAPPKVAVLQIYADITIETARVMNKWINRVID